MADKIGLNDDVRELKLGRSFDSKGHTAFHALRYDFKPASVDTSQVASLAVGENGSVEVTVPHVEGSGTANTVYKGNTRPSQKECVLIIDHKTGEITLEKLVSTVGLKKTRKEGSSKVSRPLTPTEQKVKEGKGHSPSKKRAETSGSQQDGGSSSSALSSQEHKSQQAELSMPMMLGADVMSTSDMDISSESSEDSESEPEQASPPQISSSRPSGKAVATPSGGPSGGASSGAPSGTPSGAPSGSRLAFHSTLSEDLQLSESGSESD